MDHTEIAVLHVALEALHLHAALVAAHTLEAVLMVHVPLEVAHTQVVLTAAWAHTALEVLTLVEATLVAAAKAQGCGLQR